MEVTSVDTLAWTDFVCQPVSAVMPCIGAMGKSVEAEPAKANNGKLTLAGHELEGVSIAGQVLTDCISKYLCIVL